MADSLIRQGYLQVVFVDPAREGYLKMISDAQDGKPGDLCTAVTQTQLEMMRVISIRQQVAQSAERLQESLRAASISL